MFAEVEDFKEMQERDKSTRDTKRAKYFREVIELALEDTKLRAQVNIFTMTSQEVGRLAWQSPFSRVRRLTSAMQRIMQETDDSVYKALRRDAASIDRLNRAIELARQNQPPILRQEQRLIRVALRLLLYGRIKGSYKKAVELAIGLIKVSELSHTEGMEVLRYLRMLSVIWPKLAAPDEYSIAHSTFLREIENTVIPKARKAMSAPGSLPVKVIDPQAEGLFEAFKKGRTGMSIEEMLGSVVPNLSSVIGSVPVDRVGLEGLNVALVSPEAVLGSIGKLGEQVADNLARYITDEALENMSIDDLLPVEASDDED